MRVLVTAFVALVLGYGGLSRVQTPAPAVAELRLAARWRAVTFDGARSTTYRLEREAARVIARAESEAAASALVTELDGEVDVRELSWEWRVDECSANSVERARDGDDFAARVFVLFGRDSTRTPWGWLSRRLFQSPFGSITPQRALSYVWASQSVPDQVFPSPVSERVSTVVLRSDCGHRVGWLSERRVIATDYQTAFGDSMPAVSGLAVMTDTDDGGGRAVARYADVKLHLRSGESLDLSFHDGEIG